MVFARTSTYSAAAAVGHRPAHVGVLVGHLEPGPMAKAGTARQVDFAEQFRRCVSRSEGINQVTILPNRPLLPVNAPFHCWKFIHLQQFLLQLQAPDVTSRRLALLFQFGSIGGCRCIMLVLHGNGCVMAEHLILPLVR